jgi:hypothetical protein
LREREVYLNQKHGGVVEMKVEDQRNALDIDWGRVHLPCFKTEKLC